MRSNAPAGPLAEKYLFEPVKNEEGELTGRVEIIKPVTADE
jgi:hypothetical protein